MTSYYLVNSAFVLIARVYASDLAEDYGGSLVHLFRDDVLFDTFCHAQDVQDEFYSFTCADGRLVETGLSFEGLCDLLDDLETELRRRGMTDSEGAFVRERPVVASADWIQYGF